MFVSRIEGGLGNQMFQYAYGAYLARKHQCEHWLDISSYDTAPPHGFLLDRFRISSGIADGDLLALRPKRYQARASKTAQASLVQQLCGLISPCGLRRHKESPFGFQRRHLEVEPRRYLVGYWQSEQFFPGMRADLLRQFTLQSDLSDASLRVAEQVEAANSLAVHVRRGDYLTDSAAAKIYCSLGLNYYLSAIDEWGRTQGAVGGNPQVFFFSNDMAWCRQHFKLPWQTHFVDHNTSATAYEDLVLMSLAKSCIIANSTFSWWAAWLNRREGAIIYAPSTWFLPGTLDGSGIVPDRWSLLDLSAGEQPV